MTTGEDESQLIVAHELRLLEALFRVRRRDDRELAVQLAATRRAPHLVHGPVAGGCHDPPRRIGGDSPPRPVPQSRDERFLYGVFGEGEIAEHASQGATAGPCASRKARPTSSISLCSWLQLSLASRRELARWPGTVAPQSNG